MFTADGPAILVDVGAQIDEARLLELPVVGAQLASIRDLCQAFGIDRLEVFGSVATDGFRPDSDLDFIVHYPEDYDFGPVIKRYFDLQAALTRTLGRPVDLVMASAVRSPGFARTAAATRRVLYAR